MANCQNIISEDFKKIFDFTLYQWFEENRRDFPWRNTQDPYIIWISEIILQQTQIKQGYDYFIRFIKRFPTLKSLAEAEETEVLKLWQGLGYYSRALICSRQNCLTFTLWRRHSEAMPPSQKIGYCGGKQDNKVEILI